MCYVSGGRSRANVLCVCGVQNEGWRRPFKLSDGEDAELLVYLVREEKDIYIGVVVLVCHLASRAQPG